jgi:D-threonate/D-erythronate kinase
LVLHGAGPILLRLKELVHEGKKLVVIDATSNEDLEQIALAIQNIRKSLQVLPCGSAGLAKALASQWQNKPETVTVIKQKEETIVHLPESPILIVSGSNTDTTRRQIMSLTENYDYFGEGSSLSVLDLTTDQILGLSPVDDLVASVVEALGRSNTVVLASALKESAYDRTVSLASEHKLSPQQASQKVQDVLASITVAVARQKPALKLILTGGETTESVCRVLNIKTLQVVAEAHKSIPLLSAQGGECWIVSKSGGFGTPIALASVIKFLKQREFSSAYAG